MSEDQELLARIGQLAGEVLTTMVRITTLICQGHINLYKARPSSPQITTHDEGSLNTSESYASKGYRKSLRPAAYHTRGRGASRRYPTNHSLVLNRDSSHSSGVRQSKSATNIHSNEASQSTAAYVSKRGRHNQLINSSVLDKVMQQRRRSIEHSQQRRALLNDQRERQRMNQYLEGLDASQSGANTKTAQASSRIIHRIDVDGLTYEILKNGSKLSRVYGKGTWLENLVFGVKQVQALTTRLCPRRRERWFME